MSCHWCAKDIDSGVCRDQGVQCPSAFGNDIGTNPANCPTTAPTPRLFPVSQTLTLTLLTTQYASSSNQPTTVIDADKVEIDQNQPSHGFITLPSGQKLRVEAVSASKDGVRLTTGSGGLGVRGGDDDNADGTVDSDSALLFIFPFDQPT